MKINRMLHKKIKFEDIFDAKQLIKKNCKIKVFFLQFVQ